MHTNEAWARRIIDKTDPHCRPRWEVYDSTIETLGNKKHRCLNLGAGIHEPFDLAHLFKYALDADILSPVKDVKRTVPFIQSDFNHLPFKDHSLDLVLLRFVAEHIANPAQAFRELYRVLEPGGNVLVLTTNRISPFILLPSLLIPYKMRKYLMKSIFGAQDDDIFPTYHRLNTHKAFKKLSPAFIIVEWTYLQDINWNRKWLFILLYLFHLKTKFLHLEFLRSNIIVVLKKSIP
jgi:SAM-dependent methyltransferase